MNIDIRVQQEDFSLGQEYDKIRTEKTQVGAICCFSGLVRDFGDKEGVIGLELEHYPGMTEKALHEIATQACNKWPLDSVLIIHRVGALKLADQIVLTIVSSAHRQAAFAAGEFIMDYLKISAPFWKKELHHKGGHWVEQKDSDVTKLEDWKTPKGP
ncbi:MAG: molybdenum cofactor biosynthesis protein MoaE [Pseudomonadales bacterium]|nr:molybdenum cofactor biosynthesis protein MoaE [Pseudomonadales bacterium]